MEDYEYYHTDEYNPIDEYNEYLHKLRDDEEDRNNELGEYAPTPEELYDRIGDILARSYGHTAAMRICTAWSRKARTRTARKPGK